MIVTASLFLGTLVALGWTILAARLIALSRGPWFRFLEPVAAEMLIPGAPSVAAIVPARNEADWVEATVAALRQQDYPHLTITVVDDESTDSTLTVLRRLEATAPVRQAPLHVVAGTTRPAGWVGKTWAVHQAAEVATTDWLWFVDADMGLHPRALSTALAEANRVGADLVSFLPGVHCETFWQRTIAASFLHILAHLFPLDRVNDPNRVEAIAAGGFLLIRRAVYEQIGGHAAVRHAIVEDIALARNAKQTGARLAVRLAPQLAWTHMYGTFAEIWVGLRKNAYAGMDYQPHKLVVGAVVALLFAWTPLLAILVGMSTRSWVIAGLGLWGVLAQVAATIPNLLFVRAAFPYALALPLGMTAYVAIASASAWHYHRGHVHWKGRSIAAETVSGTTSVRADKIQGHVKPR